MKYTQIKKHDATTVTDVNGRVYKIADNEQLRKLDDNLYHFVAENQFGVVMLTDRPEGSMFSDLRKRDEPTFAEAHSRLHGNLLTPSTGLAKGAGIDPDVDRAVRAVSMIKIATDGRRDRNTKIQRALRKAASSNYETPLDAKHALKKELLAEGFDRAAMRTMGF